MDNQNEIKTNNTINEILTAVVQFYNTQYGELLEQVWLFGSKARGDDNPASDIDIMVIVNDNAYIDKSLGNNTKKHTLAMDIFSKYNALISPMEYPLTDFNNDRIPLHRNVKKEGVLYYGKS